MKEISISFKQRFKNWYSSVGIYQKYRIANKAVIALLKDCSTFFKFVFAKSNKSDIYAAFRPEGGLGDILMQKNIVIELSKMFPNIVIDVYHDKAHLLLRDMKNIRFYFYDKHSLYITKRAYDISFEQENDKFNLFVKNNQKGLYDRILANLNKYKMEYPNCFTGVEIRCSNNRDINFSADFNKFLSFWKQDDVNYINLFKIRAGVDNPKDDKTYIAYDKKSLSAFGIADQLKYITVQCGQGVSGKIGNKCWDIENWEKLIDILKRTINSDIRIIQIGMVKHNLKGVDINTNRLTSFNELCSILNNSLLHIDIDGACVHIAKALGVKSIVLWWHKKISFLAYDENINLISDDGNVNSIIPEFVADKVAEYIKSLDIENLKQ